MGSPGVSGRTRRKGSALWVTVTRTSGREGWARTTSRRAAPATIPTDAPKRRKKTSPAVTGRGRPGRRASGPSVAERSCAPAPRQLVRRSPADARFVPRPAPLRNPASTRQNRRRVDRPQPGIPGPAGQRLLASVQHRVPGSLPGRDQLSRLPQPRGRGSVRGGLPALARAQPGRRDVRLRLLGALRAGLPSRRHRPAPGHPGHEAVPGGVARGVGHPRRHAGHHAEGHHGGRGRRRPGRAWPWPASSPWPAIG